MSNPTFKRGQRVLCRRSVLSGRAPEFATVIRRRDEQGSDYICDLRDEHGTFSDWASMLEAA